MDSNSDAATKKYKGRWDVNHVKVKRKKGGKRLYKNNTINDRKNNEGIKVRTSNYYPPLTEIIYFEPRGMDKEAAEAMAAAILRFEAIKRGTFQQQPLQQMGSNAKLVLWNNTLKGTPRQGRGGAGSKLTSGRGVGGRTPTQTMEKANTKNTIQTTIVEETFPALSTISNETDDENTVTNTVTTKQKSEIPIEEVHVVYSENLLPNRFHYYFQWRNGRRKARI
jgi:hypothetical protein